MKALKDKLLKVIRKLFSFPVFTGTSLLVLLVVVCALSLPEVFLNILLWIQNIFVLYVSWFYVLLIFSFFCVCLYLAFGPYGGVRLGRTDRPKYNSLTWLAMLFSAGMGTGLVFSGVYEPLYHYFYPFVGEGGTSESATLSFQLTFLHWGFSGWAVYTLMGLAMAYFLFCKNYPPRISGMLSPIFGKKMQGGWGQLVDILSIMVILFGVSATLGRGSLQINSGLKELFSLPYSGLMQGFIIGGVTLLSTVSVLSGLNKGIRRLSELNIFLCVLILLFILFTGPTVFLLNAFVEHTGNYLQNFLSLMTRVDSLGSVEWRSQWTILYWAWWIAWAPFVGLFIARISEGRTIRQFVTGALLVPSLLSALWFVVFGGSGIQYHIDKVMNLQPLLKTEYSLLVFEFLKHFPFSQFISLLMLLAVVIFFVTSSDSASYVIHHIAGKTALPTDSAGKVYWAVLEGVLAGVLIYFGGMKSMELLVIVMAFPFSILLCLIAVSFFKELKIKAGCEYD